MTASDQSPIRSLTLPKGGGALSGLGEKFSPDLHTGTGNFSVPIAVPAGRNGFQPQLTLAYSTGNGNGPFGLGWALNIPGVTRRTAKGIPHYDEDGDVYVLSGAEDLVPVEGTFPGKVRYRPRTEGLFARIERHLEPAAGGGTDHWEVATKDGLVSTYGTPGMRREDKNVVADPAVVADPSNRHHVFAWKLTSTRDPFGNKIVYEYLRDGGDDEMHHWDQIYIDRIQYLDYFDGAGSERFLVCIQFHYENRDSDPFSEHRSGFEVRTTKRCVQIDVHVRHGADRVVRRYALKYLDQRADLPDRDARLPLNRASLLSRITVTGIDDDGTTESLPPIEFGYGTFKPKEANKLVHVSGTDLPSTSLADPTLELIDLTGNGAPDLLQMNGTVRWWQNLGNGRFDLWQEMKEAPPVSLSDSGVTMMDADGDGRADLVVVDSTKAGYFPLDHSAEWDRASFIPHLRAPTFALKDSEAKLLDLDGDGRTDVLRSGSYLECWFNQGRDGWNSLRPVARGPLPKFPDISFGDPRVKTADMCGSQLQDLVLVDDGSVVYFPNLGHGNWGRPVHMSKAPRLPYGYDLRRLLIGDVDGDGLADLVYVENQKVTLWINCGGNRWSEPIDIPGTPEFTDADSVRLVDLMGSGIAGVLWSSDAGLSGSVQMQFLDLTAVGKPYLLNSIDNHMGASTTIEYASSTTLFVADARLAATRWKTTLPFPVQVVTRVVVKDAISKTQLATTYSYRHGHWDGGEREYRGFSRVEQRDTELSIVEGLPPELVSPPLLARTWFHVGPVGPETGDWRELDLSNEYWTEDPARFTQDASISTLAMDNRVVRRAKRDALRSLRGLVLRTELYAEDGGPRAARPYTVIESRHGVREIDAPATAGDPRPRIFFPHVLAQRTTQWERGDDPLTSVTFTDGYDDFGQCTRQTTVALPRRSAKRLTINGLALDRSNILANHARTRFNDAPIPGSALYIADRVCEREGFEPVNSIPLVETNPAEVRSVIADHVSAAASVHADFMADRNLKRNGHVRTYYDGPAFTGLPLGRVGNYGAATRTETLVFTDAELDGAYDARRPSFLTGPAALPPEAPFLTSADLGYRRIAVGGIGHYYVDSLQLELDVQSGLPGGRGLVTATRDAFAHETTLERDPYALFPLRLIDAAGLVTEAAHSYRVMQPERVTDPNRNASVMEYTPLGLPRRMFLEGRDGEGGTRGDPELEYRYDFAAFDASGDPVSVTTIARVNHVRDGISDEVIRTTDYSDGFGRQVQSRRRAQDVAFGDSVFGNGVVPIAQGDAVGDGRSAVGAENTSADPNVVVSGWKRFDNKGRVIEHYESIFGRGWDFDALQLAPRGQSVRMYYDPRGRLVRTVNPDGSEHRAVSGVPRSLDAPEDYEPTPWESYHYDANDLAPISLDPATIASHAAQAPIAHHFTPASLLIDGMGRSIARMERNGAAETGWIVTRCDYDMRGNLLTITDALNRVAFRYAYDFLNRSLRVDSIDSGLRTTVLNAAGAAVEDRDSKGALTLRIYADALNRATAVWARDDNSSRMTVREVLTYGDGGSRWQPEAARIAARDKNQLTRVVQHDDEAGRRVFSRYDFKGNLVQKSRFVISDAALASGWTPDWGGFNPDAALDPTAYETTMRFDALSRPTEIRYPTDAIGHRALLVPSYNRAGSLERITLDGGAYVERIAYNARGQRTLLVYGNAMMTRFAYEPRTFRLARLHTQSCRHPNALTYVPDGNVRQDCAYSYDLVGNVIGTDERVAACGIPGTGDVDQLVRRFEYDPFYRLMLATGRESDAPPPPSPWLEIMPYNTDPTRTRAYTERYSYDQGGNVLSLWRTTSGSRTYVPELASNRLRIMSIGAAAAVTDFQYAYDPSGNVIQETTSRRYAWDHANRLKRYEEGAGVTTKLARYLYGADGMRVKKWVRRGAAVNDESTTYIEGLYEQQRWNDGGEQRNDRLHVMDGIRRIATVRVGARHPEDGGEAVEYAIADHLGSCVLVIGGANVLANTFINREEYTPFGDHSFGAYGRKRYRFCGKERDEESGLRYYGLRYFAPWLARWLTCDPAGSLGGHNSLAFVRNNPVSRIDSLGAQEEPAQAATEAPATAPQASATDSDFRAQMPLIGRLRQFFGISAGEKKMLDADLEAGDVDKLMEGQQQRGRGVEAAGTMLRTTGEVIQAATPGPKIGAEASSSVSRVEKSAASSHLPESAGPGRWERFKSWVSEVLGSSPKPNSSATGEAGKAAWSAPRSVGAAARRYAVMETTAEGDVIEYGTMLRAYDIEMDEINNPFVLKNLGEGDWVKVYARTADVEVVTAEGTTIEKVEVHWYGPRDSYKNPAGGVEFKIKPED